MRCLSIASAQLVEIAAGIGDPHPLEDALNRPVFAAASVQRVEHHVGANLAQRVDEAPVEIERLRVVPERRQRAHHGLAGLDRNLTFGAGTAHDDRDA